MTSPTDLSLIQFFVGIQFSFCLMAIYAMRIDNAIKCSPVYYDFEEDNARKLTFKRSEFLVTHVKFFRFNKIAYGFGGLSAAILTLAILYWAIMLRNGGWSVGPTERDVALSIILGQLVFFAISLNIFFVAPMFVEFLGKRIDPRVSD